MPNLYERLEHRGSLSIRTGQSVAAPEKRRMLEANNTSMVYDFEKWKKHRSSWTYLIHCVTMLRSHTMAAIFWPTLWVTCISILVGINGTLGTEHFLPKWLVFPTIPTNMGTEPMSLTSFAIALLLVFRTNASYARFDDGRKLWAYGVARSRDIVRQAVTFFPDTQSKATFARWTVMWLRALLCHMQNVHSLKDEAEQLLSTTELEFLMTAKHPTVVSIQAMSQVLSAVENVSPVQLMQMNDNLTRFHDVLGGCERIMRTPIPVAYTRHTSRCVVLWLTFFPYIVWNKMGWFVVPVSILMSMCLLGINEIGVDLEEPFSILPLESITSQAKADISEAIQMQGFIKMRLKESNEAAINGKVFTTLESPRPSAQAMHDLDLIPSLPVDLHGRFSFEDNDTVRLLGRL